MQNDAEQLPVGDLEFLQELAQKSGVKITRELIIAAPLSVEKEVGLIVSAISNGDIATLKAACHALKGACYSVQMQRLGHYVRAIEAVCDDITAAREILPFLEKAGKESVTWWTDVLEQESYLG